LEQALLSCCVLDGGQDSVPLCIQRHITEDSFYYPAHRVLFAEIHGVYQGGTPLDETVLVDSLGAKGKLTAAGGALYIGQICSRVDTYAYLSHYIARVRDYELLRRVIAVSQSLIVRAFENQEEVPQFLAEAEEKIFEISKDLLQREICHVEVPMQQNVQTIQMISKNNGTLPGVETGFIDLDRITSGLHPGEMVVVAARPSMGKTSLALNIAENVVLPGKGKKAVPTLFFSLEMGADQLAMRLLCGRAGIAADRLRTPSRFPEGWEEAILRAEKEFRSAPLWIDDSSNLTILEMRARARRLHSRNNLGFIVIDYLQLIAGTDGRAPREQQISEISRGVKAMAKELGVPVVVLSQLNRESEKENRRPRLSDLRESGAIEQDADVVLLLTRAKDVPEDEELRAVDMASGDWGRQQFPIERELLVAKQRNGQTGVITLLFDRGLTKYKNYAIGPKDDCGGPQKCGDSVGRKNGVKI
jgi:replicative DNA helicase